MSENFEVHLTPFELDLIIYGITLIGLTNAAAAAAMDLTPEERAQFERDDDKLHTFHQRLDDLRATAEMGL